MAIPIYDISRAAITEVQSQFDLARDYATEAKTDADTLLTSLSVLAESIHAIDSSVGIDDVDSSVTSFVGTAPTPPDPTMTIPDLPTKTTSSLVLEPISPTMSPGTIPGKPTVVIDAGSLTVSWNPGASLPSLGDISIDTGGSPVIDVSTNVSPINPAGASYDSPLLTALKTRLLADVQTDIDRPSVEVAKWDRARARDLLTHQASLDTIRGDWSKSGLPLPDGALTAGIESENVRYSNTYDDRSGQIAIEEANLAIQVRQSAIAQAVQTENILMTFANTVQERIFQASRATVEAEIQVINAVMMKYRIMTDIYQAVSNIRIAKSRAEVDAYSAGAGVYKAAVDAEAARWNAEANIYQTKASVEIAEGKGAIDIYGSEVQAYKANVDAEAARVNAEVNVYQALSSVQIAEAKSLVDTYVAEVQAYKANVDAEAARVDALAKLFSSEVEGYKADASVYQAVSGVEIEIIKNKTALSISRANLEMKEAEIQIAQYQALTNLKIEAMKAMGSMVAQQIAGALSSIHATASMDRKDGVDYNYNVSETLE